MLLWVILFRHEQNPRFTFNFRKESKATEVSESSFKDKYDQVYESYMNSISYVPGFKNRSNAIKAVLSFSQAQNSFSYALSYDKMPPILKNDTTALPTDREQNSSVKMKKTPGYKKKAPIIMQKKGIAKYFTPQKISTNAQKPCF